MSLVADYDSSSSDDSDDQDAGQEEMDKSCEPNGSKLLPLPSASLLLSNSDRKTSEVLCNPFLEAEKEKTARLEKHVKMVETDEHLTQKNGRKICWNNRKGRCRFGSKCQFAHESDLNVAIPRKGGEDTVTTVGESIISRRNVTSDAAILQDRTLKAPPGEVSSKPSDIQRARKRAGLADSIQPGKRVMKTYLQQQTAEHNQ